MLRSNHALNMCLTHFYTILAVCSSIGYSYFMCYLYAFLSLMGMVTSCALISTFISLRDKEMKLYNYPIRKFVSIDLVFIGIYAVSGFISSCEESFNAIGSLFSYILIFLFIFACIIS